MRNDELTPISALGSGVALSALVSLGCYLIAATQDHDAWHWLGLAFVAGANIGLFVILMFALKRIETALGAGISFVLILFAHLAVLIAV